MMRRGGLVTAEDTVARPAFSHRTALGGRRIRAWNKGAPMQRSEIDLVTFEPAQLAGALALSQQAGWPHRLEDWRMALALSEGVVALDGTGRVVGTALVTPYSSCATVNMVIVDETMRGQGVGRRLMDRALTLAGNQPLRLVATREGLPLYDKLGFREVGAVAQHQGIVAAVAAPAGIEDAQADDLAAIGALDRAAFGADRTRLIGWLATHGCFAVARRDRAVAGYGALREFGRGEVIGPVVAEDAATARALLAHFLTRRQGAFVRVDTTAEAGLSPWLVAHGLAQVGGGVVMRRPAVPAHEAPTLRIFALANQALG